MILQVKFFNLFILLFVQGKTTSAKKAVLRLCPVTTYDKVQHTLHTTTEQKLQPDTTELSS